MRIKPFKLKLSNTPKELIEYCEIASQTFDDINGNLITVKMYKWPNTDRITLLWDKKHNHQNKHIGRMELHWREIASSLDELWSNVGYLTLQMELNGWGVLDLRDMTKMRSF